ncbi:MAG: anaerobic ribonucleoside-triphosphate reductase activating protein [Alphaproteobacteria bacterium]|nr:anaerobic ribonucleoside-triphosphate reductase activating protein [Alphaproteobacteria bacterium]
MNIGGFLPFTTIDFPGKLSAVIFTQGCPLRCPYCHNPELQNPSNETHVSWQEILSFLKSRQKLLDGIVFSGGEPLLQTDIEEAVRQVKELGFAVGLHTSGAFPDRLERILHFVDWVGLDIKSAFNKYTQASGTADAFDMASKASKALDLILNAGVALEVRTTTDPRIVSKDDILSLAQMLSQKGVKTFALQEYRPLNNGVLNEPDMQEIKSFYNDTLFENQLKSLFPELILRKV